MHNRHKLLLDVIHAPTIRCNLLSILALINLGFFFSFKNNVLSIYLDKTFYGHGYLKGGLFMLDLDFESNRCPILVTTSSSSDVMFDLIKWHSRLGHIGQERLSRLTREGLLGLPK